MTRELVISVLGPLTVTMANSAVNGFVSRKAQALLAYLAVESARSHTRDELAGLLWPEYPSASARASLRSVLANVRAVVGDRDSTPPVFLVDPDTIQLNAAHPITVDTGFFDTLPAPGQPIAEISRMEAAVARVRGPFLAGLLLPDSPPFEEWVLVRREFYARRVAESLHFLAHHYEARQEQAKALSYARQWCDADPWNEEAHQLVMRLLAAQGQRSLAIAHFERCRQILAGELGIEPSPETLDLADRIRRGEVAGAARASHYRPMPHTTPRLLMPTVGRAREIEQLSAMLADPRQRLITIVGPGGAGKSHLATAIANRQEEHFRDGAAIVALAGLQAADGIAAAVAHALHLPLDANIPVDTQVRDYLTARQMLLVLDNFEHLLDGTPLVQEWLHAAGALKVLATSRVRLNIAGEQLLPLGGLPCADDSRQAGRAPAGDAQLSDAMLLFIETAQRLRPDWPADAVDLAHVQRICRLLDGMPLAILLAASWIQSLRPAEIAAELEAGMEILRSADPALPERHRSIETVFEHSWRLLSAGEQQVFAQLAVFHGGFTREAAAAVTGATLAQLHALTGKFFINRNAAGRFTLHVLLRQFAAHKRSEHTSEPRAVQTAHATYYLDYAAARTHDLVGVRQAEVLRELEADAENLRSAWQWAAAHGRRDLLLRSADAAGRFYTLSGRYHEGERIFRFTADRMAPAPGEVEDTLLLARLLRWHGHFCRHLGLIDAAGQSLQRGLAISGAPEHAGALQREYAVLRAEQGMLEGNHGDAQTYLAEAAELLRASGDDWDLAHTLWQWGSFAVNERLGNAAGHALLQESLQIFQRLGDRLSACTLMAEIGFLAALRGDYARGGALAQQALHSASELDNPILIARCATSLAYGHLFAGRFTDAYEVLESNASLITALGKQVMTARLQIFRANILLHLGAYNEVLALTSAPAGEVEESGNTRSFRLWQVGDALLALGTAADARAALAESVVIHRQTQYDERLYGVLTSLGLAAFALGDTRAGQACLAETVAAVADEHLSFTVARVLLLAVLAALARDEVETAVELYALAASTPHVANSRWYDAVIGEPVRAASARLPADTVRAAQARGASLSLPEGLAFVKRLVVAVQ